MNEWATNKLISAKTVQEAKDALSAGANLHFKKGDAKRTPIMLILKNKAPYEVINFVVSEDPSIVNELDGDDTLPVVYALRYMAKPAVTELLINETTNIDQQDTKGDTPLICAFRHGAKDNIKRLLINKTKNIDAQSKGMLTYRNGHVSEIPKGRTALMEGCRSGCNAERLYVLIENGANVNAKDKNDCTALMYAAKNGRTGITYVLIYTGAKLDLKDNNGCTALMWAAIKGHKDIVDSLIKAGAKLDLQDKYGRTALMYVAKNGCATETLDALIKNGANVNAEDKQGWTSLWYAVYHDDKGTVRYLLQKGAIVDLNKKDKSNMRILNYTSSFPDPSIRQLLLTYAQKQSNNKLHNLGAKQANMNVKS